MKSATKGLLPSNELLSQLHSVHSTNILSDFFFFFLNLVPLIFINMCHYNHPRNKINKKAGDVIGPWGKIQKEKKGKKKINPNVEEK